MRNDLTRMKTMTTDEMMAFHDNLADVLEREGEEAAQDYLARHLRRLPENVRQEVLTRMFFDEIVNEARETAAIREVQERGLAVLEVLNELKKQLNKAEKSEGNA